MKELRFLILLLVLALPGCFTDSSVNPDFGGSTKSFIASEDLNSLMAERQITVTGQIDGRTGGSLSYNLSLANIYVAGSLTAPRNAFDGTLNISTTFDNTTTTQSFGPSPFDFRKPLLLTLEYSGVNLNGVNPADVDFYYIGDDGLFYKAEYSSIVVDPAAGILKVVDAKINHFSRYGWAK